MEQKPLFDPKSMNLSKNAFSPTRFEAGMGRISLLFAYLEDGISNFITMLLGVDNETGRAITSEVSFKQKLHMLGSLFLLKYENITPKDLPYRTPEQVKEFFQEILKKCRKAE